MKPGIRKFTKYAALVLFIIILAGGGVAFVCVRRHLAAKSELDKATAALAREDWLAARRHLGEYLSEYPEDVGALRAAVEANLNVRPLQRKNVRAAIQYCRRLMRLRPGTADAFDKLVALYAGAGRYDELIHVCELRLKAHPGEARTIIYLARALMRKERTGEDQRATEMLLDLLKGSDSRQSSPGEYAAACRLLGKVAHRSEQGGPSDKAVAAKAWLDRAVSCNPDDVRSLVSRAAFVRKHHAELSLDRKAAERAVVADLLRAENCLTEDPLALIALCGEWMQLQRYGRADAALRRAERLDRVSVAKVFLDPTDWRGIRFRQRAALTLAGYDVGRAETLADEMLARSTDPRSKIGLLSAAIELYVCAGRTEKANRCLEAYRSILQRCWKSNASPMHLAYLEALSARSEGDYERVAAILEPVVMVDISDVRPWKFLAESYRRMGRSADAIEAMNETIRLEPTNTRMILALAHEYAQTERWTEAYEAAARAVVLCPTNVRMRLDLAHLTYTAGYPSQADRIYAELLQQDPRNIRAINDRAWMLGEDPEQLAAAFGLVERGLQIDPNNEYLRRTCEVILARVRPDTGHP